MSSSATALAPLPTGCSTFRTLREDGSIYVDKTALICELASKREKFFLARPRRFGKSLLISTFASLFSTGTKDFKGLAAETLWNDPATYEVVTLDFSSTKDSDTLADFDKKFSALINREFGRLGFRYDESASADLIDQLSGWLQDRPSASLVLLVDEYDAPLTAHLNEAALFAAIRDRLSNFYLAIKSREGCLRFFFMTGITKFQSASIFSAFNSLTDISAYPRYGTLLGYTEEELQASFGAYLQQAAERLQLTRAKLLSQMREMYDGFCFDMQASSHVYVPWSVLQFLAYPENGLLNYWFDSAGKPTALMNYLKAHRMIGPDDYANDRTLTLDALLRSADLDTLEPAVLLFQAGYLSIAQRNRNTVVLRYPNQEVAHSLATLYSNTLLRNQTLEMVGAGDWQRALLTGDVTPFFEAANRAFAAIDGSQHPINDEKHCRTFLQIFIAGANYDVTAERHDDLERSTLALECANCRWVLAIHCQRPGESPDALLAKAAASFEGMPDDDAPVKPVLRVAAVFSEEKRQFVRWQRVL